MPVGVTKKQAVSKPEALTVEIHRDIAALRDTWRGFQQSTNAGPHDTWEWNDAWVRTLGKASEPLVAIGRSSRGEDLFLLPLTIRRRLGCSVLEWLSADQGNYASGLFRRTAWKGTDLPRDRILLKQLLDALPPVDAVHLNNLPAETGGTRSPLSNLPSLKAASAGHAFPLSANWEAHYMERFSGRMRGEFRRSERRLAEQGELRFRTIAPGVGFEKAMDRMIRDKQRWFAEKGIHDFFNDRATRDFYTRLAALPQESGTPHLMLFELAVDGRPVAANLGFVHRNTFYGLISSTTDGPLLRYSPGNILFLRVVEYLAERGIECVDCGAGEDENKLRWCTIFRERLHTICPVTPRGHVYAVMLKTALTAKLRIKQSPRLWSAAKRLRQFAGSAKFHWPVRRPGPAGSTAHGL